MGTTEPDVLAATFAATAAQGPLTEFTFFPKLPIEIRLKIFKHALPIGPQSFRMLRVAVHQIVSKSITTFENPVKRPSYLRKQTLKTSMFLTFQLLEHQHNSFVRDFGLLVACSESRGVYLKRFTGSLRTGEQGLIRFAKEDIVYIANMDDLSERHDFISDLNAGVVCEDIPCQNLALPVECFGGFSDWWRNGGKCLKAIFHCKSLRVGAVWNDWQVRFGENSYPARVQAQWQEPRLEENCPFLNWELKRLGIIEKQWEACEELQKRKETLPKLGILGLDGSWVKREEEEEAKETEETASTT